MLQDSWAMLLFASPEIADEVFARSEASGFYFSSGHSMDIRLCALILIPSNILVTKVHHQDNASAARY